MIYLSPPLCITREDVDYVVRNLNEILGDVAKEVG